MFIKNLPALLVLLQNLGATEVVWIRMHDHSENGRTPCSWSSNDSKSEVWSLNRSMPFARNI